MVYRLREFSVFAVCHKIVYFRLYGRLFPLGTIISGTPQNVHTSEITKFFIESRYHLCCVFSSKRTN